MIEIIDNNFSSIYILIDYEKDVNINIIKKDVENISTSYMCQDYSLIYNMYTFIESNINTSDKTLNYVFSNDFTYDELKNIKIYMIKNMCYMEETKKNVMDAKMKSFLYNFSNDPIILSKFIDCYLSMQKKLRSSDNVTIIASLYNIVNSIIDTINKSDTIQSKSHLLNTNVGQSIICHKIVCLIINIQKKINPTSIDYRNIFDVNNYHSMKNIINHIAFLISINPNIDSNLKKTTETLTTNTHETKSQLLNILSSDNDNINISDVKIIVKNMNKKKYIAKYIS